MRIDTTQSKLPALGSPSSTTAAADAAHAGPSASPARQFRVDSADVSPMSQRLREIEQNLSDNEPFDAAKVERIKTAIQRGEYQIRPEAIAAKVIESAKMALAGGKERLEDATA